jgi:hypothetical protein
MTTLTRKQIKKLREAAAILNSIDGDLYDFLIDTGCQPSTAGLATGEILSAIDKSPQFVGNP